MAEPVELHNQTHAKLRVNKDSAIEVAASQHLINIRALEVGKAVSCFPVFITKITDSPEWAISAVTSLEMNANLFVRDAQWQASYTPNGMQVFPFFLMRAENHEDELSVAIDEDNPAFSEHEGEEIFDDKGQISLYMSRISKMLQEDVKNSIDTRYFTEHLEKLGLIKAMDLKVHYENGTVNNLKGLSTIDEEKFNLLDAEALKGLQDKGYLGIMYALLISIYQLNGLILRHNQTPGLDRVIQVKMEVSKDEQA